MDLTDLKRTRLEIARTHIWRLCCRVTRISYFAALAGTPGAVSPKGKRMKLINVTVLDRKSGGSCLLHRPDSNRGELCAAKHLSLISKLILGAGDSRCLKMCAY
jgi:hypothetical protein